MWRRMMTLSVLSISLVACHSNKNVEPTDGSNASLCAMLKQQLQTNTYENNDLATMKRKNATDQAQLAKQYDSYNCAEILDSGPLPY